MAEARDHMHCVFDAWRQLGHHQRHRSCRIFGLGNRQRWLKIAWHEFKLQRIVSDLKDKRKLDVANQVREVVSDTGEKGIRSFAQHIRNVLRQGRKYQAPRTAPVIRAADGALITDSRTTAQLLGKHFSEAEQGVVVSSADIRLRVEPVQTDDSVSAVR